MDGRTAAAKKSSAREVKNCIELAKYLEYTFIKLLYRGFTMGDISFSCPGCSQPLEAPEEMAGEALACPSCGNDIVIPSAEAPAAAGDGTKCQGCGSKLAGGAVICVQCGFDLRSGKVIDTKMK